MSIYRSVSASRITLVSRLCSDPARDVVITFNEHADPEPASCRREGMRLSMDVPTSFEPRGRHEGMVAPLLGQNDAIDVAPYVLVRVIEHDDLQSPIRGSDLLT